jgi:hypothetical protein
MVYEPGVFTSTVPEAVTATVVSQLSAAVAPGSVNEV